MSVDTQGIPLTSVVVTDPDNASANDLPIRNQNNITDDKESVDRLIPPPAVDGVASTIPDLIIPEEFNLYRNKKTLTQGLMDIALFSANANQLRYIIDHGAQSQAYFYIASILIMISLVLQIAVGLLLLLSTQYNLSVECQRQKIYKYGNYVVVGIFLITVVNIFIAAFGGPAVQGQAR